MLITVTSQVPTSIAATENWVFDMVTFQHSTLINTFFKNNRLKQIRFIDCQADRMIYEFLKKTGKQI